MIFKVYISFREEKTGIKWYQGVIHNCDGFNTLRNKVCIQFVFTIALYIFNLF